MISDTGNNLSVLIATETSIPNEWMSYACWYSFYKNAPDANVSISCQRSEKKIHQLMNWANRLKAKYEYHNKFSKDDKIINKFHSIVCALNKGFITFPLLVVDADVLLVRELKPEVLDLEKKFIRDSKDKVWFFGDFSAQELEKVFDEYAIGQKSLIENAPVDDELLRGTKENSGFLLTIEDGMGRFDTRQWINKNKGSPFGKAFRFHKDEMFPNEKRVLELWGRMASLFKTIF